MRDDQTNPGRDGDEAAATPAWIKRLLGEYLRLADHFPASLVADEDCPEWVQQVDREVARVMFPMARLKESDEPTPRRIGAMLGHTCAYAVWMIEGLEAAVERQDPRLPAELQALIQAVTLKLDERDLRKGAEALDTLTTKFYPGLRRLAKMGLCWSVNGSYEEMSEFLLGFANAFAKKPRRFGLPDVGSPAFKIYVILLWSWRPVQRLESVAQLHRALVQVLGPHQAGDLKRLEKICQRIGLSFRKPGRPRKPEKIPTP